jgi:F-type H+-transporting ATPase subunit delta
MKEQSIARVYAKALLEIGDEKKIDVVNELIKLTEVINSSNNLENVLFLDVFTTDEKKSVLSDIAKKINLSSLLTSSLNFIVEEKRLGILPLIVKECVVYDDERKGFLRGTIEGFEESISPELKEKIKSQLKKQLGKEPSLTYIKNNNITAGYKITVEDLQLDASVDNQLQQFKNSFSIE